MHFLDENSLETLKQFPVPSYFHITLSGDAVKINKTADKKIFGDMLVFADDINYAFEFVMQHKETIDFLFYVNSKDMHLTLIARPDRKTPDIEEVFSAVEDTQKDFEKRTEQIELAKHIKYCMDNSIFGIFEAPTGTGKSLAYLIPSILFAKKNNKKVVISTNTINLQRQLIEKDLPVLKSIMDFKVDIALGRSNYLCKRKADNLFNKGDIFLFEEKTYKELKNFLENSKTGLKSELFDEKKHISSGVWDSVSSTSLSCAHIKCPYYKNRCFYYRAKAELDSSDIIIANHHIVLSDSIMKDAGVLPQYSAVVFDEAHNLEKNATSYFTQTVSTADVMHLLNRLYSKKKKKKTGLLLDMSENEKLSSTIQFIEQAKDIIHKEIESIKMNGLNEIIMDEKQKIVTDKTIKTVMDILKETILHLESWKENVDISAIAKSLDENANLLEIFLETDEQDSIKWIKKTQAGINFNITPVSIDDSLRNNIYANCESVIFTSATISINRNFDFFKKTVGINKAKEFIAKNNFDYGSLSKLILLKDMPMPDSPKYTRAVAKSIIDLANALKDNNIGALILFTSYRMLNETYEKVFDKLTDAGFNTLKQGDFDNFETLNTFKKVKSFLFATSSFWEGIDVKGDALSVVFITRLPFEVPNTPIEQSRYNIMKQQGINAFFEYSLPKAVLKFRQGFGRLIRDKSDKGVIVVSDSRIVTKKYGKMFIDSLPKPSMEVIKSDEIKNSVCSFFGNC